MRRRRFRQRPGQGGFTVIEMAITTGLLGLVLSAAFGALISFQNAYARDSARVGAVDQTHLAIEGMATILRSANSFSIPSGTNGYEVAAYIQAGGVYECQAWKISGSTLSTQTWSVTYPGDGSDPSGWHPVATGIDNSAVGVTPFTLTASTQAPYYGRLLAISFYVKVTATEGSASSLGSDIQVHDSVTGRDVEYGTGGSECTSVPS